LLTYHQKAGVCLQGSWSWLALELARLGGYNFGLESDQQEEWKSFSKIMNVHSQPVRQASGVLAAPCGVQAAGLNTPADVGVSGAAPSGLGQSGKGQGATNSSSCESNL
jgi:hypothetical protein